MTQARMTRQDLGKANMSQLIAETLSDEMARDERIVVFGEDVGRLGGVFGATRLLQRDFGADRVLDAPISEMAFTGLAVGAAQAGLRPVVELMFVDFIGVCLDQIFNQMAKNAYMSGGRVSVPVVLRTAVGCIGAAAQHSQVLTGLFAHLPGLKVVFPSAPYDAPGLLRQALADPNPVVFMEHKLLLKTRAEKLPYPGAIENHQVPREFGHAHIVRHGKELTIATVGWSVQLAAQAAELLAERGVDAEVMDLQTIVPLDRDALITSARRTGHLLVVDEDYLSFGMSGELVAVVCESLGSERPYVARHAVPDVPIPASRPLEEHVLPSVQSIANAAQALLDHP